MLYWICPECGHECSPAIRECPTCTAPPVQQAASKPADLPTPAQTAPSATTSLELLSLAQNFQSSSSTALLTEAPPQQLLVAPNGREPEQSKKLAQLDNLDMRPARPTRLEPAKVTPAPVPARLSVPSVAMFTAPARTEFSLGLAGSTPPGKISFQAANGKSGSIGGSAEPLPSRRQSVAFVRAERLGAAAHGGLALADLAPLDKAPLQRVIPSRNGQPKHGISTPVAYQPSEPSLLSSGLNLTGASLVDLLNALRVSAEELERAGIHAISESFRAEPAVALLSAPAEIVTAPAPPAEQWIRTPKPRLAPKAPEKFVHPTVIAGPQATTLAGPCLPPQLLNFHQTSSLRGKRRRGISWPITLIFGMVFILGSVMALQFLTQDRDNTKAASVAPPAPTVKAAPSPRARVVEEHPAARSVEVAGVRVVMGINKKPQLQYIVINHSAIELTGLNVRIAVRSVESLEEPPLFSVSSVVASLGPNQSKEIRMDLDPAIQPASLPDWQSLRTEVLVARQ